MMSPRPGPFAFVALAWFNVEQLFGLYINEVQTRQEGDKLVAEFFISPEFHNFPIRKEIERINKIAEREKIATLQLRIIRRSCSRTVAVLRDLEGAKISSFKISREKFEPEEVTVSGQTLENKLLKVEAPESGALKITDKPAGKELVMEFSDRGDRGDSYNYDPVPGDQPMTRAGKIQG